MSSLHHCTCTSVTDSCTDKENICLCNQAASMSFPTASSWWTRDVRCEKRVMQWEKQAEFKPCIVLSSRNIILPVARWLFSHRPWSFTCFWMSNKERELLCHSRTSFGLLYTVNGCISVLAWSKTVKFLWSTSRLHRGGLADRWFGFPEPNPRFTLC